MNTSSATSPKRSFFAALDEKLLHKKFPLQILNRDQLRYLALFLMTLGHWATDIMHYTNSRPLQRLFLTVGFFAPPVFFFFIAEGYHYTRDRKKYALRLLLCAVIVQIPHTLTWPDATWKTLLFQWSVLMTLFLGLLALTVLHSTWKLPLRLIVISGLMLVSRLLHAEWSIGGILVMLGFDLLREKPLRRLWVTELLMFAAVCIDIQGFPGWKTVRMIVLPSAVSILVITFCYSGKKGRFPVFSKWFFYVWYPLHLLISWFM